jgi:hypothetical protein
MAAASCKVTEALACVQYSTFRSFSIFSSFSVSILLVNGVGLQLMAAVLGLRA